MMAEVLEKEGMELNPDIMNIDRELEELLKKQSAKVKVFGVGGGGGSVQLWRGLEDQFSGFELELAVSGEVHGELPRR